MDHGRSLVGLALCLFGCETAAPEKITRQQACRELARAYCEKLAQCSPFLMARWYPDTAGCEGVFVPQCQVFLDAAGSQVTSEDLSVCAGLYSSLSCYGYQSAAKGFAADPARLCSLPAGTVATGKPCGADVQCQGRLCAGKNFGCGACSVLGRRGAFCTSDWECQKGLACSAAKGPRTCLPFLEVKAVCGTGTAPCHPTLACRQGICATPAKENEPCDPGSQDCDALRGLWCSETGRCAAPIFAALGERCENPAFENALCGAGTYCDSAQKKCQPSGAAHALCDDNRGPRCVAGFGCIDQKCGLYDPNTCLPGWSLGQAAR